MQPDPSFTLYTNHSRDEKLARDNIFLSVALRTMQFKQSTVAEVFYNPVKLQTEWLSNSTGKKKKTNALAD